MKAIKKETNEKGNIILTCETTLLFGLINLKTKYIATKEYPRGYWNWAKLPNKTLVNDMLSFQLDSWCADFE